MIEEDKEEEEETIEDKGDEDKEHETIEAKEEKEEEEIKEKEEKEETIENKKEEEEEESKEKKEYESMEDKEDEAIEGKEEKGTIEGKVEKANEEEEEEEKEGSKTIENKEEEENMVASETKERLEVMGKITNNRTEISEEINKPIGMLLNQVGLSNIPDIDDKSDLSEDDDNSSYHLVASDFTPDLQDIIGRKDDDDESSSSDTLDSSLQEYSDSECSSPPMIDFVGPNLPVSLRLLFSYCDQLVNHISESTGSMSIPQFDFTKIQESVLLSRTFLSVEDTYISSVASQLRSIQDILLHFDAQISALKEMSTKRLLKFLSNRNYGFDIRTVHSLKRKVEMFEWKLNSFFNSLNSFQNKEVKRSLGEKDNGLLEETFKLGK